MKSTSEYINIFIVYLFLSIYQVISVDFQYPTAIGLPNGNIFIVEKNGIFVYDEQLLNAIYNYPFEENEKIDDTNKLANTDIKFQNNYIICLINLKIYFFDCEGNKLLTTDKIIVDENISYPSITPIDLKIDNFYYYIIGYFLYEDNYYKIKLVSYKIDLLNNENVYLTEKIQNKFTSSTWGNDRPFANKGLSCEYMQHKNKNQDNFFTCFFIFEKDDTLSLSHYFFEVKDNLITLSLKYNHEYVDNLNDVKDIKTITNSNRRNSIVCLLFSNENLECHFFNYPKSIWKSGHFYQCISTRFNCRNELYGLKLNHLYDVQTISLSCINPVATIQAILLDDGFNIISSNEQFNNCTSIYGHSVLKLKSNSDFYVISDVICENVKMSFEPLEGNLSPIHIIDIITPTQIPELEYSIEENEEENEIESEEEKKTIQDKSEKEIEKKEEIETIQEKLNEEEEEKGIIEEKLETIKGETIEEKITEILEHKFDCSDLEKCNDCDRESFSNNLCINCNKEKNYYYLNIFPTEPRNKYINCVNETLKPLNYYFNKDNLDYEPCFTTCATCKYGGNSKENNCTSCDGIYYVNNPESDNSFNCVIKCKFFYYIENNIYKCTENPICPEDYNNVIQNKTKCINDCRDDKEFKYRYNGECFKECPNNTKDNDDFFCKDIQINKCHLTINEAYFLNENTNYNEIEKVIIKYIKEFNYTSSHVSVYKNDEYTLTIYINKKCIFELELGIPEIDFSSCYEKIINNEEIHYNELIIAIIDKKIDSNRKIIKYGLFSPTTGKYLKSDEICKDNKIMVVENLEEKILESGINFNVIKDFINDGIDIFNISSPFYHDICYQYNFKRDVPLKDRVFEFFPNISLCEKGCDFIGINMSSVTSICQCSFNDFIKEDNLKDKVLDQAQIGFVEDILTSSNIYVVKCFVLLFEGNTLKKCIGGFVIFCLILVEIISTIFYCTKNLFSINKYIFVITNKYINFLMQENLNKINEKNTINNIEKSLINKDKNYNNNAPPKQKLNNSLNIIKSDDQKLLGKSQNEKHTINNGNFNLLINANKNKNLKYNNNCNQKNNIYNENIKEEIIKRNTNHISKFSNQGDLSNSNGKDFISKSDISKELNSIFSNIKDNLNINIEEYLETQLDDMDYDEAIRKDHRKFCEYFSEKIKNDQIIINTFCSDEFIKPKSIKILLLILQVILYFFINGLFYDEKYISNIYHLKKDTFFTMAGRFFDNLIYAALAGIIINYIIEFFFVDEIKIKKILKMEKENIFILKYEMIKILKSIKLRYKIFIIISFVISFIALIHICCFNIVYYHTMKEWFAFSLIIFLSIQIGSILFCFVQTALRFLSFKFKSEKLFKLSL